MQKNGKNNYYMSILLTSSKSNWQNNQKIKHTNTGGANFSPSKSKYTPGKGLPLCKYFQASIGKHLTTTTKNQQQPQRAVSGSSHVECPPPASGFGT